MEPAAARTGRVNLLCRLLPRQRVLPPPVAEQLGLLLEAAQRAQVQPVSPVRQRRAGERGLAFERQQVARVVRGPARLAGLALPSFELADARPDPPEVGPGPLHVDLHRLSPLSPSKRSLPR